jgi:hypothetical protein
MNQITKEELVALNSTMKKLYEQAQYLEETGGDRDMLAEILERIHQQFDSDPDDGPEDFSGLPYAVEKLIEKCNLLKGEVVTAGNYAACRLNVLREIHSILGLDGLQNEAMSTVTGVSPQLARLPKRVKQLLTDVTTWRERYDKEVIKNGELMRENETLALNVPPEPPLMEKVTNADPVVLIYNRKDFPTSKLIGQAWCRTENRHPGGCLVLGWGNNAVLCNVLQAQDGSLTYSPIPFDELPHVGKAEAP